jgi:integrase/recombinase XerD
VLITATALRFLYKVSFKGDCPFEDVILPQVAAKMPVVLSPEEVLHLLGCTGSTKHRAILTTCYTAGLPISEHRQPYPSGKGQKDRSAMPSANLALVAAALKQHAA